MPLHALYDPRRPHELVVDAKGRFVATSYAEWCSFVDRQFEDLSPHAFHPLTDQQPSTVH